MAVNLMTLTFDLEVRVTCIGILTALLEFD